MSLAPDQGALNYLKIFFARTEYVHSLVISFLKQFPNLDNKHSITGHEIAPNTVANATKIIVLATKIQKLVAKLATRTLWVLYILPWCFLQLNKALK